MDLGDDLDNVQPAEMEDLTPLQFLLRIMNNPTKSEDLRIRVAGMALPYMHEKVGEPAGKGKKEQQKDAAEEATRSKFAPSSPPKLTAVN